VRRFALLLIFALTLAGVTASQCTAQILHKKKNVDKSTETTNTVEPDKQLYDKAIEDIKHGKHEIGRLSLQTLINTYPDSEYLAKAKLAIADSYYKEGGTSNITQAVNGYKDFIVFFPFLPEAAYAQAQVAMCHFNEMPKPDRDSAHAKAAEEEFQTFLTKYPKDPLAPEAQQHLREVQEVLAEGQYRIGYYYYVKQDKRAAAGRLIPLVKRYPLYSKTDSALWMLADVFEKSERKDIAGNYYAQIVKNYPLSKYAAPSKGKLQAFGMPIPQPDPKAVEWMTAEQNAPRPKETVVHRGLGILHPGPDVHTAARSGVPTMEPESDQPGTDTLTAAKGSSMGNGGGAPGSNAVIETVKPGDPTPAQPSNTSGANEDTSAGAPASDGSAAEPAATPSTDGTANGTTTAPATDGAASTSTPAADGTTSSTSTDAAKSGTTSTTDPPKESSSKKKGLKKLIPW
jgi:outer membrane protein assembly factor BamD